MADYLPRHHHSRVLAAGRGHQPPQGHPCLRKQCRPMGTRVMGVFWRGLGTDPHMVQKVPRPAWQVGRLQPHPGTSPHARRRPRDFREDKPTMIVLQYSAMRREALTFWKYSSPKRRRYFITPAIDSPSFASCPPSSSKSFMKDLRNCFDIYFDFRIKHNGLPWLAV